MRRKVKAQPKPVVVVALDGHGQLTQGRRYTVVRDAKAEDAGLLRVVDDADEADLYLATRFDAVEEEL